MSRDGKANGESKVHNGNRTYPMTAPLTVLLFPGTTSLAVQHIHPSTPNLASLAGSIHVDFLTQNLQC